MKFICMLISLFMFSASAAGASSEWRLTSADERRAIANDNTPPSRVLPLHELPTAEAPYIGTVRRVRLNDPEVKVAALTFDMCELATVTTGCNMEIIDFLRSEGIPATLFMGGKWMRTHAERVKLIMTRSDLFEIGNHAWSHGNFALLSPERAAEEAMWTQAQYELILEEAGGGGAGEAAPVPALFRLPYGRCNDDALRRLAGMGFKVIQWDVAAESGDNSSPKRAAREARKVAAMTRPGSILLFHANLVPKGSTNLLRETVRELRKKGYSFVKVSELLQMGTPEISMDGYFTVPGDNLSLDKQFGPEGTGVRR